MIAIVILGFGMIMVATLFPVGWQRARRLSEHTTRQTVIGNAHALMQLMARVDGRSCSGIGADKVCTRSSFAGDLIVRRNWHCEVDPSIWCDTASTCSSGPCVQNPVNPVLIYWLSDTRVHALNVENLLVVNRAFIPEESTWVGDNRQDRVGFAQNPANLPPSDQEALFVNPQVRFEDRVHPPLRSRVDRDFDVDDPGWDEALDGRRFAWAVLSKLRERIGPVAYDPIAANDAANDTRTFDMYYITLRRPQSTHRYTPQATGSTRIPHPLVREQPVVVEAKPGDQDVLLPVPWRVQIVFPPDTDMALTPADVFGIPTQVLVNPSDHPLSFDSSVPFLVDLFQKDTICIDEVSGALYRVVNRRLVGDSLDEAVLTLDRELTVEDIDDGPLPMAGSGTLQDEERLRVVWVFPPPVQPRLNPDNDPVFAGPPPVVSIDVRTLSITP